MGLLLALAALSSPPALADERKELNFGMNAGTTGFEAGFRGENVDEPFEEGGDSRYSAWFEATAGRDDGRTVGGFDMGIAKGPRHSGNRGVISYGVEASHESLRAPVFPDFGYRRNFGDDGHAQVLARPFGFHWDREHGDWGQETGVEADLEYHVSDALALEAAGGAAVVYDVNRKTLGDSYTDRRGAGFYAHASAAATIGLPQISENVRPFARVELGAEHTRYTRRDQVILETEDYSETREKDRRTHARGLLSIGVGF